MNLIDPVKPAGRTRLDPLKASDIRVGMRKRWCAPEWAVMWEVGDATGARQRRYADAVMMSLWPSRGLELHGVEIKVTRSDFKREAADPTKAEAIARFCDRWWVHTSPGVVDDLSALPMTWGLREFDGKAWKTIREASKLEPEPMTRTFLAALLRRADETMTADARAIARKELEAARAKIPEEIERAIAARTSRREELADKVKKFQEQTGINLDSWYSTDNHVAAFKLANALVGSGFDPRSWNSVQAAIQRIEEDTAKLKGAVALLGVSPKPEERA
jgi:hypothetical protein